MKKIQARRHNPKHGIKDNEIKIYILTKPIIKKVNFFILLKGLTTTEST
jgi:hypothetical protein